jgi:hypothetical protein
MYEGEHYETSVYGVRWDHKVCQINTKEGLSLYGERVF